MNKKITISIMAALMISGLTSIKTFAAMDNGSVVIGNNAFDLGYANDPINSGQITAAIVEGGKVYVKDFGGKWIDNFTGLSVNASIIPAVTYRNYSGTTYFDTGDKDQAVDGTQNVTSVSLNKTSYALSKESSYTLSSTIFPSNATNKAVTWTSSNVNVATVINGVTTAVSSGTTIITATTVDGSKTASCAITVNNKKGYVDVYTTLANTDLKVRSTPNPNLKEANKVGDLYDYQKIEILNTVIGTDGLKWDKIIYDNKEAYVSDPYIIPCTSPSDDVVSIAENITKQFEGGDLSKAVGNTDGQGISLGYLQWNIKQGTLQHLLNRMDVQHLEEMKKIFGTNYSNIHSMILDTPANQFKWAIDINNSSNNIIEPWNAALVTLCKSTYFKSIEDDAQIFTINNAMSICDNYNLNSVRGFALAFDIANQNGSIKENSDAAKIIDAALLKNPGMNEKDRLLIIANAVADTSTINSDDTRIRKLAIVNGQGVVHGITYNLDNDDYKLSDNSWR